MENFDIAKYLKENHLGPHSILGGYVDLHALKEVEDMEGLEIVKGFGALKDKSVADKYAEVCKQGGMKGVKVIEKDGVFKIYAKAGQKLNKEAEDLKDIETSDLKKGDTVEYEGTKYIIGDFDTAGGANLVYLKTVDGEPAEDSKGRYKKVHKSRVKKLNKEADYGNNEPVDKVPYGDGEGRLDGFGDEFDQVDPVEEANGPFGMPDKNEDNPWMSDVDGTDAYKVGNWTCYYDYPGVLIWSYGDKSFNELAVYATPNYDGDDTTPIQIDVNGENEDMMALNQGIFADFNEYARAMKPYLDRIENLESNWGSLAPVEEDFSYDDDTDDVNPFPSIIDGDDDEDQSWMKDDRFADLGGDQIKAGIKSLMDDGFDTREIAQFVVDTIRAFKSFKEEVTVSSSGVSAGDEWKWSARDQQGKLYGTLYVKPMGDTLMVTADDGMPGMRYSKEDIIDAMGRGEFLRFRGKNFALDTKMKAWANS